MKPKATCHITKQVTSYVVHNHSC